MTISGAEVPAIPDILVEDADLRNILIALKTIAEIREGRHQDTNQRFITYYELVDYLRGNDQLVVEASTTGHNHNDLYSVLTHDHDADYSPLIHEHDSKYALIIHSHNEFAGADHDHDSLYSPIDHDHDGRFALVFHDHNSLYSIVGHNHDTDYAPLVHDHDYADRLHSHGFLYALTTHEHQEADAKAFFLATM